MFYNIMDIESCPEKHATIALDHVEKIGFRLSSDPKTSVVKCRNIVPVCDSSDGRRSVVYASGMSGSGKTTFAVSMIVASLLADNRPSRVLVITREKIDHEPAFFESYYGLPSLVSLDVPIHNFDVADLIEQNLTHTFLDTCAGWVTYLLLDDMDSLINKDEKKYYKEFEHLVLTRARKYRVNVFICNHRPAGGESTKWIVGEMTGLYIPFRTKISANFKNMLITHADLGEIAGVPFADFIETHKDVDRWAYISLDNEHGRRYCVTPSKILFVD